MISQISALAALLPLVSAHGFINDPPARRPGDAYTQACGQQPFFQQSADINGNVQGIMQVVGDDITEDCKLWLCKGFQFEDNTENVQSFSAGQTIDFDINIAAPHTGFANVSIVRTATDQMVGTPLIEFDNYASNAGVDANNTAFSVTMPDSIEGCTEPGECVLQWFWDAPDIDQTYESCVDFVVGAGNGGGSEPQPGPSTTAVVTPEPTTSAGVPEQTSSAGTPEPTGTTPTPPEEDEDDCEEIPDDELPEEDDDETVDPVEEGADEDDCEEIPDDELPEEDDDTVDPVDEGSEGDDDCEEIPDDAEELPEEDDCEEIPADAEEVSDEDAELPTRDQENCEDKDTTLPIGDNDSDLDFDAGGDFVEKFPDVAPGPDLITISTGAPEPTATTTATPPPAAAPTNGNGNESGNGKGNGNGNGNQDGGKPSNGGNGGGKGGNTPAATVTVTVTASAVTVTATPSLCLDLSDLFDGGFQA